MKGQTISKLVLTFAVVLFFGLYLFPINDTPFEQYVLSAAEQNEQEFAELLDDAKQTAEVEGKTITLALEEIANQREIDLQQRFFPQIRLSTQNLERKNDAIVRVLYEHSRSALRKGLDLVGGTSITYRIDEELGAEGNTGAESQLEDAVDIMRERVDGLGVAEPVIRPVPPNRLEVQLPGINPEQAADLQKAARLDFRLVHPTQSPPPEAEEGSYEFLPTEPWSDNSPQARYEVMGLEREQADGTITEQLYYVKETPEFSGSIEQANAVPEQGRWAISLDLTSRGAEAFAAMTGYMYNVDQQHLGQPGAMRSGIVLDGELASVLGLSSQTDGPITGGRASITGGFSQAEAVDLANVLNNPLEFELVVDDMSTVSPSFAEDARQASVGAAILGAALVVVFMIGFYLSAGGVAVLSVILNVITVLGVLAALQATITLPGVAAIVLTIGMAVDANILIFERIREELRAGKSLATALEQGYAKAFSTIVDANVTTFITAMILIWLGSGPVRGFGVTLAIGIATSMFGALIISKAFLEILVYQGIVKTLIPKRFEKPFKFIPMNYRWPAFGVSWAIVLLGVAVIAFRGDDVLGIDFTGGAEMIFDLQEGARNELSVTAIEDLAAETDLGEVQVFFEGTLGGGEERLIVQVDSEEGRIAQTTEALAAAYPDAFVVGEDGSILTAQNLIGPAVSETITINAFLSVFVALVGILGYVALRFEIGFGAGAVVATIHDVLMTIGLFVLLGGQFTSPMIAAILMIVGYSINDTIVVFDRIREELDLRPEMSLLELVNFAINRTLSRTVLTSITTLLAAVSLFVFGEGVIKDYAMVFIIGIITGTFSSIFIATPVFFAWHKGSRQHVEEREMERPVYEWETGSNRPTKAVDE
ncbi:MAG: protein translocase subunit SecD [Opitutales bacterium]